jgi:HSP20 family molecular chaperone IbpA
MLLLIFVSYISVLNAGFTKDHFKVQVDSSGKLSVKGQKQFADNEYKRFNKVFQLPPDSDIENIRGKFEGFLTLTVSRIGKVSDQRGG